MSRFHFSRFIKISTVIVLMAAYQSTIAREIHWQLDAPQITQTGIAKIVTDARNHFLVNPNDSIFIHIPPGSFLIGGNGSHGIDFSGGLNPGPSGRLIFQGSGMDKTILIFTDLEQDMIYGRDVNRLEFRDMHMTRNRYTVTQGTVVSVNAGEVIIDIETGFPSPVEIYNSSSTQGRYLRKYTKSKTDPQVIQENNDQVPWGWRNSAPRLPEQVDPVAYPMRWRIYLNNVNTVLNHYKAGDYVGIKSKRSGNVYWMLRGNDLVFRNIRWTHSSRGLVRGGFSNVLISGCRIERAPAINGQTPCLSTAEGGPQMNQYSSTGNPVSVNMVVENTFIDSPGDDNIAFFNVDGGVVRNCLLRNSFARGIMAVDEADNICIYNTEVENSPVMIEHVGGGSTISWTVEEAINLEGPFHSDCAEIITDIEDKGSKGAFIKPIHVFPNPITFELNIAIAANTVLPFAIYDQKGIAIVESVARVTHNIDTSMWPSGIYFLFSKSQVIKIIKR